MHKIQSTEFIHKILKLRLQIDDNYNDFINKLKPFTDITSYDISNTNFYINNDKNLISLLSYFFCFGETLFSISTTYMKQLSLQDFLNFFALNPTSIPRKIQTKLYLLFCKLVKLQTQLIEKCVQIYPYQYNTFNYYYKLFRLHCSYMIRSGLSNFQIKEIFAIPNNFYCLHNNQIYHYNSALPHLQQLNSTRVEYLLKTNEYKKEYISTAYLQKVFTAMVPLLHTAPISPEDEIKIHKYIPCRIGETFYTFQYLNKDKNLSLLKTNDYYNNFLEIADVTIKPSTHLCDFLTIFCAGDLNRLKILSKLLANIVSPHQSLKKLILIEGDSLSTNIFLKLFQNIFKKDFTDASIRQLCKRNEHLPMLTSPYLANSYLGHDIILVHGESIKKLSTSQKSTFRKLINGSSIYFTDYIFKTLFFNNWHPIIYHSENLDDYLFMLKNFSCLEFNVRHLTDASIYDKLSSEDYQWINRYLIPWGKLITYNPHPKMANKFNTASSSDTNSIAFFINKYCFSSDKNLYPEDLFDAYKDFYGTQYPQSYLCSQSAFTKVVCSLNLYKYGQVHIRETKQHSGSNRRGFKKISIDYNKLNVALKNPANPSPTSLEPFLKKLSEYIEFSYEQVEPTR